MKQSKLVKSQSKKLPAIKYTENGNIYSLIISLRYDDNCGNGHNSFAITADIRSGTRLDACGCCHDDIIKHAPKYAHLIKWHLCSSDGPMHYIANTVYNADQHGPTKCHIKFNDEKNGLSESSLKYCDIKKGQTIVDSHPDLYSMEIDLSTAKEADYDAARSSAIWPEATDEMLARPDLKDALDARLPALLSSFADTIELLGFTY
ncbi:hypothetical protein KAU11_09565 [Candidatus Babeliales bacterium]|nr:hypothetical protein [Candidatus Babeliales bacterium]